MIFIREQKRRKAIGAEGERPWQALEIDNRKVYERPALRKLTWEQATLFLVGQAYVGDKGARELLELLFPEPMVPE